MHVTGIIEKQNSAETIFEVKSENFPKSIKEINPQFSALHIMCLGIIWFPEWPSGSQIIQFTSARELAIHE